MREQTNFRQCRPLLSYSYRAAVAGTHAVPWSTRRRQVFSRATQPRPRRSRPQVMISWPGFNKLMSSLSAHGLTQRGAVRVTDPSAEGSTSRSSPTTRLCRPSLRPRRSRNPLRCCGHCPAATFTGDQLARSYPRFSPRLSPITAYHGSVPNSTETGSDQSQHITTQPCRGQ